MPKASSPRSACALAQGRYRAASGSYCRKVGIDNQSRFLPDQIFVPLLAQFVTERRSAAILPDNRVVDWLACFPIPNHGGFALVSDANGGDGRR